MAFDKPPGLLTVPTPKDEKNTLTSIVNQEYAKEDQGRLHPCHRLDRDTSGVILYAKGKKHQQLMMDQFFHRRVNKKYTAFVYGHLKPPQGEIKSRIKDIDQRKFNKHSPFLLAIMHYRVVECREHFCIAEVFPLTGRTNQIRIQMSQGDHPIIGDRKYTVVKHFPVKFKRTALHASELRFTHPVFRREVRISSPLPQDMNNFLTQNN